MEESSPLSSPAGGGEGDLLRWVEGDLLRALKMSLRGLSSPGEMLSLRAEALAGSGEEEGKAGAAFPSFSKLSSEPELSSSSLSSRIFGDVVSIRVREPSAFSGGSSTRWLRGVVASISSVINIRHYALCFGDE